MMIGSSKFFSGGLGITDIVMEEFMRPRLKWILPACQAILAAMLGYWGSVQTLNKTRGGIAYDYISPPELVLHIVNLPAAALVGALSRTGTFQIGVEHSVRVFIGYLVLVFGLWFLIGWRAGYRRSPSLSPSSFVKSLGVLGVLSGLFLILVGVLMLDGPMSILLTFAAFLWGVGMIVLFGSLIRSRRSSQQ